MLVVVRHGRTEENRAGLLLGRADPALDAEGLRQAAAMAEWLGPVDRVIVSPLQRACQTAEAFDAPVEVDDRWIELDYGEYDRRPVSEIPVETWARWRDDPGFAPPGGESMASLHARVAAACDELLADVEAATIVVVTHVSPIKAVLAWAIGASSPLGFRTRVGQPSITRIAAGPDGPVLHSFNEGMSAPRG